MYISHRLLGSFGHSYLSMKSLSFSQRLSSCYKSWSCLGDLCLLIGTQYTTAMKVVLCNFWRLLCTCLHPYSSKSVTIHCLLYSIIAVKVRGDLLESQQKYMKNEYCKYNKFKKCPKSKHILRRGFERRYYSIPIDVWASLKNCSPTGETVSIYTKYMGDCPWPRSRINNQNMKRKTLQLCTNT